MRDFLQATRGAPEHPGLRKALDCWTNTPGLALDLGCGAGRDSLALLRAGWKVVAIDCDQRALEVMREQSTSHEPALTTICCSFEDAGTLPAADLINASFSLPFCRPEAFDYLWSRITQSLRRKDGLFCGHFFGPRDAWADKGLTIHTRDQLVRQMDDWALLELNEFEYDGKTAVGRNKHWHLFEVIARRG